MVGLPWFNARSSPAGHHLDTVPHWRTSGPAGAPEVVALVVALARGEAAADAQPPEPWPRASAATAPSAHPPTRPPALAAPHRPVDAIRLHARGACP
ncbi:hypothetical protein [Streptomyces sp. NPDC101206]|uniref:hypothetical protein n=1 Tax=Streptomyces sp. NPDC101206 TaxID=3366128 RepID=UPI0037FDB9F6